MAVSFHVIVPLFLAFAAVDMALLSVRTLFSRQRHSLTTLYALMGVQEAMIFFELLATLGLLLSTYLVTAGMWSHIASIFAVFSPLWVLRAFFTAFTMVYKSILIPRWTAATRQAISAGDFTRSVRAWHAGGYGAVVVLDVVCCCAYYLAAVYVLGYLSDKTLYVPYHRQRWRHEQAARAVLAAEALAEAAPDTESSPTTATTTKTPASATQQHPRRQQRQKRGRGGDHKGPQKRTRIHNNSNEDGAACPVISLARTPSFAQWQHAASGSPNALSLPCTSNTVSGSESLSGAERGGRDHQRPIRPHHNISGPRPNGSGGLPSFSSVPSTSAAAADGAALNNTDNSTVVLSRTTGATAAGEHHGGSKKQYTDGYFRPPGAASRPRAESDQALTPPKSKRPTALLEDLPPLRLSHRFDLNSQGKEGHLNQFAAALVEHGFTTQSPDEAQSAGTLTTQPGADGRGSRGPHSDTAVVQASAGCFAASPAVSPSDRLADCVSPTPAHQSTSAPSSASDAALAAAHAPAVRGNSGQLRRTVSEPTLLTADNAAKSPGGSRSSLRRMLSVWSGFKGSHARGSTNNGATEAAARRNDDELHREFTSPLTQFSTRRPSLNTATTPLQPGSPRRKRSTSQVHFALDGSGSGDTQGGHGTPPLPPRPQPSFRIDQATGNVVAIDTEKPRS